MKMLLITRNCMPVLRDVFEKAGFDVTEVLIHSDVVLHKPVSVWLRELREEHHLEKPGVIVLA